MAVEGNCFGWLKSHDCKFETPYRNVQTIHFCDELTLHSDSFCDLQQSKGRRQKRHTAALWMSQHVAAPLHLEQTGFT